MKKETVALAAALVVTVAAPAAAQVDLGGSLESEFTWSENVHRDDEGDFEFDKGFSNEAKLDLQMNIAGESNDVKAVLELKPWESLYEAYDVEIDKWYIESDGAYWNGGPSLHTRVGNLDVDYSEYVAHNEERGVSVGGMMVGPVRLSSFMSWDGINTDPNGNPERTAGRQSQGLHASTNVDGIALSGTVIQSGTGDAGELAYELRSEMSPMAGIDISAVYAADGNDRDLIRIDGEMLATDKLTLIAGYRDVTEQFGATHTLLEDEDGEETWVVENRGVRGVNLGVETVEHGYEIAADTFVNLNEDGASRGDSEFSVAKGFELDGTTIDGSYKLTVGSDNVLTHELGAATTLTAIPALQGLGLEANVKLIGDETEYNAHATYAAPNGIELGAHFDTEQNRGVWVDAGVKVEF